MNASVRALFVCPEKKARAVALTEVRVGLTGFEGDFHGRSANRRQILMLSNDVLCEFGLSPGMLHENMVIDGVDIMSLTPGQNLHIGDAVLEVTVPCEPCVQMDRIRQGLQQALEGKRGMFARVASPGTIRIGDTVKCQ
jgi:MOSC domain-containing protein YiiM